MRGNERESGKGSNKQVKSMIMILLNTSRSIIKKGSKNGLLERARATRERFSFFVARQHHEPGE